MPSYWMCTLHPIGGGKLERAGAPFQLGRCQIESPLGSNPEVAVPTSYVRCNPNSGHDVTRPAPNSPFQPPGPRLRSLARLVAGDVAPAPSRVLRPRTGPARSMPPFRVPMARKANENTNSPSEEAVSAIIRLLLRALFRFLVCLQKQLLLISDFR